MNSVRFRLLPSEWVENPETLNATTFPIRYEMVATINGEQLDPIQLASMPAASYLAFFRSHYLGEGSADEWGDLNEEWWRRRG